MSNSGKTGVVDSIAKSRNQRIEEAARELLQFVRDKYPDDFKNDPGAFTCEYHKKLYKALEGPEL